MSALMQKQHTVCCWSGVLLVIVSLSVQADDFKLTDEVVPTYQAIKLTVDPNSDGFSGSTTINIDVKQPTRAITLYAKGLLITAVSLQQGSVSQSLLPGKPNGYDMVALNAQKLIPVGKYLLLMDFFGQYSSSGTGLYKVRENNHNSLFSQFQPMQARSVFPSFDQPNFKIPFQFTVKVPKQYEVLSNTHEQKDSEDLNDNILWRTVNFAPTLPIYTDVLALAVGQFDVLEVPGLPMPAKLYVSKGKKAQGQYFIDHTATIFNEVAGFFGQKYPYQKLDFIAVPQYGGAGMENVGLIFYKEAMVLFAGEPSAKEQKKANVLIAHEIAHMWFGNSVTMRWWNDLWLNESFAQWLANKVVIKSFPGLSAELDLPQLDSLGDDQTDTAQPLRRAVTIAADVDAIGQMVYSKGTAILNMVEQYVGEAQFARAVVAYINQYSHGNATAEDFVRHIKQSSTDKGKQLDGILASFLNQPGFPLISLKQQNDQLVIRQQPFGAIAKDKQQLLWQVPLNLKVFTDNAVSSQRILLEKRQQTIKLPANTVAVFPDAGAIGYYRYDLPLAFEKVIQQRLTALLDHEKLAWLENNQHLSKVNKRAFVEVFLVQLTLLADASLNPKIASDILRTLNFSYAEFVPAQYWSAYSQLIKTTLAVQLATIGWAESHREPRFKAQLLALAGSKLADKRAIAFAKQHYLAVLQDNSQFGSELSKAILEVVASTSGATEFSRFKQAYLELQNQQLKGQILTAMGHFEARTLITRYYDFLLSGRVPADDIGYRFQYPLFNPALRHHVADYIGLNKQKILSKITQQQWFVYNFYTSCEEDIRVKVMKIFTGWQDKVPGLTDKMATINNQIKQCIITREQSLPGLLKVL
jgi:alanyl aminopeptidase